MSTSVMLESVAVQGANASPALSRSDWAVRSSRAFPAATGGPQSDGSRPTRSG